MPDILNEALSDSLTIDSDIRRDYYCVCVCVQKRVWSLRRGRTLYFLSTR